MYESLEKALVNYAKSKKSAGGVSEYEERYKQAIKLYADKEGYTGADGDAKIQKEVVADLVGDYLFQDEAFVRHLSQDGNLFQKIYDEIMYLCKLATAGSAEAKELEKIKKVFEKAMAEAKKNPTNDDGGVKYKWQQKSNSF